ncbi:hypothetical protein HKD37_17G048819 [Glycine soja]
MEEIDGECLFQPLNPISLCFSQSQALFVALNQLSLFISANFSVLKALGLLSFRRLTQRTCLAKREVSHTLSELDVLLSGCISLSQSASLSESSTTFTFSSLT